MFYGAAYITNNSYNLPCFFSKNPVFRHFFLFINTDPVGTLNEGGEMNTRSSMSLSFDGPIWIFHSGSRRHPGSSETANMYIHLGRNDSVSASIAYLFIFLFIVCSVSSLSLCTFFLLRVSLVHCMSFNSSCSCGVYLHVL